MKNADGLHGGGKRLRGLCCSDRKNFRWMREKFCFSFKDIGIEKRVAYPAEMQDKPAWSNCIKKAACLNKNDLESRNR